MEGVASGASVGVPLEDDGVKVEEKIDFTVSVPSTVVPSVKKSGLEV